MLSVLLSACGGAAPLQATPPVSVSTPVSSAAVPSGSSGPNVEQLVEAQAALQAERMSGAMALFDSKDGKLRCSDPARCERGYLPASTFKIANTIIGLETGVLEDAETALPWDGKQYSVPEWNRDHTLRSAIQVSCVPCFQSVARKVGAERMQDWVTRLDYGNRDISGKLDAFWLTGGLRISPFQQIDFLRRLDGGRLPIQAHTLDVVRDVLTLDVGPDHVLRGKTGLNRPPEQELAAWFVGFVELGERRVFFATVIDAMERDVDIVPVRRRVTERVLRALGDLPS